MNKKYIFNISKKHTPEVKINIKKNWHRHDIVNELKGNNNIGVELGVAKGVFAKRLLNSLKFKKLYGVDMYNDVHDTNEYANTLKYLGLENSKYYLLRMDFESANNIFKDESFDFIYVDGFAHSGEEGGKTLIDWYKKLKIGGILAGDDYHSDWPLVVWAVNDLAKQLNATINLTEITEDEPYSKYPSWYLTKKENHENLKINALLYKLGMREKSRVNSERVGYRAILRSRISKILRYLRLRNFVIKLFKLNIKQ